MIWKPTRILRQKADEPLGTSTSPIRVETDDGDAYIKALGNDEGPHALACDWLGTHIASQMGLQTFASAIIPLKIAILRAGLPDLIPGPVFATRVMEGEDWDGTAEPLSRLENPEDLAGMVVLDCLIRNTDRCVPDAHGPGQDRRKVRNVFLSRGTRRRSRVVVAMDHTHCFGRSSGGHLPVNPATIDAIQDERPLGLFREFLPYVSRESVRSWARKLAAFKLLVHDPVMSSLPSQWEVDDSRRRQLVELVVRRADWLHENLERVLSSRCGWTTDPGLSGGP